MSILRNHHHLTTYLYLLITMIYLIQIKIHTREDFVFVLTQQLYVCVGVHSTPIVLSTHQEKVKVPLQKPKQQTVLNL